MNLAQHYWHGRRHCLLLFLSVWLCRGGVVQSSVCRKEKVHIILQKLSSEFIFDPVNKNKYLRVTLSNIPVHKVIFKVQYNLFLT